MKLSELQKHLIQTLRESGIPIADQEARIMLETRLGLSWSDLIARGEMQVDSAALESDLAKRIAGVPLGRLYGVRNFYGLDFHLSPDTLEPRGDSETLIDVALERFRGKPPASILDLGTGTGCLLITLLHHWKSSFGVGVDRSAGALQTARLNADKNLAQPERCRFLCMDWADGLQNRFDLVISNPPYIASHVIPTLSPEVRNHDPILALDGGIDGLEAYKKIFPQLRALLKPSGIALFEIGYDQERNVERLSDEYGLTLKCTHRDKGSQPRVCEIFAPGEWG